MKHSGLPTAHRESGGLSCSAWHRNTAIRLSALISALALLLSLFSFPAVFAAEQEAEPQSIGETIGTPGTDTPDLPVVLPVITMSDIYRDGMVLQRGRELPITGACNLDGVTVTVTLTAEEGGTTRTVATASAVTDGGSFTAVLPALTAARDLTLTLAVDGVDLLTYRRVAAGEVWLTAGQSNMQFHMGALADRAEYVANMDNYGDRIRLFYQEIAGSYTPAEHCTNSDWYVANSRNIRIFNAFSAIGYIVATELATELEEDVVIGVIAGARGGSSIRAWFSYETVEEKVPAYLTEYERYSTAYGKNGADSSGYVLGDDGKRLGTKTYNTATFCYNAMMAPIVGYTVGGVLWYQGEADAAVASIRRYADSYRALTEQFRRDFCNAEMPFLLFQIAPCASASDGSAMMRNAQYALVGQDAHTYLVSTAADGPTFNAEDNAMASGGVHVHPSRKAEVAYRAARILLSEIYGVDTGDTVTAPQLKRVVTEPGRVTLTFDTDLRLFFGDTLCGFEVRDAAGKWQSVSGRIEGNTVVLNTGSVTATTIRYGYTPLLVEMRDGTLVSGRSATISTDGKRTTLLGADGKSYLFIAGSGEAIRATNGGNLTNASGHPMPSFSVDADGNPVFE